MFPTFHISSFSTFHISIFSTFDIFLSFLRQVMMLDSQTGAWVEWHPMRTRRCRLIIFLFHLISIFLSALSFFLLSLSPLLTSPARAGHAVGVVRREQLGGGGAPGLNIFLSITQQCMCVFSSSIFVQDLCL